MTYREFIQVLLDRANAEGVPASGSLAYLGFAPASYTIKVTGKPNWVWVRLAEEDERTPTQALNLAQVRLFPDLPVRVRKEGGVLAVVGYDPATIDVFLGNRPINITSPEANEPDLVGPRRIKPGLVHAYKANDTYSMTVQVEGFWYLDPATRKATYQPPGTLDLTSHIPAGANQHVYALVVFDRASKTLSAISGTPKLVTLPLDDGDITGIAVGSAVPVCAVKLTTGMTALDKDYYFVDVRPWWTIAGEPLLVAGGAPLTINAGAVMASQTYHILAAETDTTDDLDTVVAAAANTFLLLQAGNGDTITVKHGTGNIQLNGAADFVLSGDKTLLLFFDGTTWSDVGAGGGGGGALIDHDHSGDTGDGGTFDAANLTSGAAADGQVLTADGAGGAAWEDPTGGGASQLSDLSDVDTSTPTNRNVLVADGTDWESRALEAADIQFGTLVHERGGLEADVSAYGGLVLISGGATSELKLNLNASAAPTANDDSTSGYAVGSRWVDTTNDKEYVCLDASTGTAVWAETTQAGTGGGDPDAIHDNVAGEIAALTEKASPASADLLLIEDSAASNAKKKVQIGNLPGGGVLVDHDHSGDAGDGGTFDAANLTSGAATDGQVLTADGAGGAAWEDPTGGGSGGTDSLYSQWQPDAPPETPHEYDDEFDGDTLNAAWTVAAGSVTVGNGFANVPSGGRIVRSVPSGDFAVWAKISWTSRYNNYDSCFFALANGATWTSGTAYSICPASYSGSAGKMEVQKLVNGGWNATPVGLNPVHLHTTIYLRWQYIGGTVYASMSVDGISWRQLYSVALTPQILWLYHSGWGMRVEFVRFSTDIANNALLPGRMVPR